MTNQVLRRPRAKFVSKESVEQLGAFLQELPEKVPQTLSLRQTIEQLREPIEAALSKGYSYEELVPMLAQEGIEIQPSTLKRYVLTRVDRDRKRSSGRKPRSRQSREPQIATDETMDETTDETTLTATPAQPAKKTRSRRATSSTPAASSVPATGKRGRKRAI